MTVSDLIARLSEYPADMPVRLFAALKVGSIETDDPCFAIEDAIPLDNVEADAVPTLFIDIN